MVLPNQHFLVGGTKNVLHLWKFLPDGQPDSSFSQNGFVSFGDTLNELELVGSQIDSLGKLFLLAYSQSKENFSIFKRKENGKADTTFGINGKVEYKKDGMEPSQPNYLRVERNKIKAIGSSFPGICLIQLDEWGNPDSTFQNGKEAFVQVGGSGSVYQRMRVDSSGNIWVIGFYGQNIPTIYSPNRVWVGHIRKPFLVKFDPLGNSSQIDLEVFSRYNQEWVLADLELGPDKSVYISGTLYDSTDTQISRPFILKLKPNEIPDSSFHEDGLLIVNVHTLHLNGEILEGFNLAIQKGNKVLLNIRHRNNRSVTRVGVVRYSQFGILDTSFNHQGYQFAPRINPRFPIVLKLDNEEDIFGMYAPRGERIYVYFFTNEGKWCKDFAIGNNYFHISGADLTIKPNGKFIITFAYTFKYSIYQYNNNGTRDSTFGFDGFESVSFTRGVNTNQDPYSRHWYTYLAGTSFMPNGDIIMAGDQYSDDGKFSLILTRLDSNGHRKLAFGQDGKYYLEFGNIAGSMYPSQQPHLS